MNIRKLEAIVALNKLSKDRYRKLQNQNFKIKTSTLDNIKISSILIMFFNGVYLIIYYI